MGAWGAKPFENDDAADWAFVFEDKGPPAVDEALGRVVDAPANRETGAPAASEAVAAAGVVAAALDGDAEAVAGAARRRLRSHREELASEERIRRALDALERVLDDSELKGLWAETDDYAEWALESRLLADRLRSAL